ncbi:hypothetical protein BRAS3843_570067 [Bradyrhizobium sp. STM 3843]|uniref:GTPase domain-containing protein n=1 Tax=Bradyrhizobium sp. STM 3843 TaxID=551947 RepID=UPI00024043B6|nr:GTPase domain-containing protein [Bradyrhizobium sp. STM 3843]CCE11011.1 hypothetical protein BRAS3843_570067 [Bradyrhizobium sp. STM 3843]
MHQKRDEYEIDVQASKILAGLRDLGDLLEEPETGEALDLAKNARTTEQYNILRRLRQSLTQYLERDGDLFYVGLVGHFSSGKSSTINSILNIWGSERERETDLNPTDTTITLITNEGNAKSLLGVIREGHVTIRHESVDNDLLQKIVIADTPGSGDTQFVEEVARDFLPICDVILFFFSATSPLDKTDLPLLTEIHKKLRFIPIRFVVTRADEFRIDASRPVAVKNIDTTRRDRFLGDVLTRLNKLLEPTVYTEEHFILIDNKAGYNIDELVELIRTKCDPGNPNARIVMHGHKIHYFQSAAKELKAFFGNFIDDKLRELNKIVSTAEQNIQLYNKNVLISNNNLTKNWHEQFGSIRATRERAQKSLRPVTLLASNIDAFEAVLSRQAAIGKALSDHAHFMARQLALRVKLEVARNLRSRIEQLQLWEFSSLAPRSETVASNLVGVDPNILLPLVPAGIGGDWASLRDAKVQGLRDAATDLRRLTDDLQALIDERIPIRECETEVNNAQKSLTLDLEQFFTNAQLYRDGVFSHTTKESISALGIGARLDALESEFTQGDTAAFVNQTMQTLFPEFNEISARALTSFAAIEKDLRPLVSNLNELRIPSPATGTRDIGQDVEAVESELQDAIGSQLRDDVQHLGGRLDIQISSAVAEAGRQYDADIRNARRRRRWKYVLAIAGPAALVAIIYLFYVYINRDVPQDIANAIIWNLAAAGIGSIVASGVTKWSDDFPKTSQRIVEDARSILKGKILAIVDEALQSHEFSALAESRLSAMFSEAYARIINNDPDGWNQTAAERIDSLGRHEVEYCRLRTEYETTMEELFEKTSSYFSDASKNLDRLNEVAANVKKRAIEPSFELLAATRSSLEDVRNQIHAVQFHE